MVYEDSAYPSQVEHFNRIGYTDQTLVGEACLMSAIVPRCADLPKRAKPTPNLRQAIIDLRSGRAACGTGLTLTVLPHHWDERTFGPTSSTTQFDPMQISSDYLLLHLPDIPHNIEECPQCRRNGSMPWIIDGHCL
jgi:hypothetical protein